jgi:hypothetical protein
MKKLMLMPLLVGVVWVCAASPIAHQIEKLETPAKQMINENLLTQIFEEAVPLYASQYGVEVSVYALQNGYDNGTVSVEDIGGNRYRVTYGGDIVISDLEDFL